MQVGDDQQALLFPEQRAGEIGDKRHAGDIDSGDARGWSFVLQGLARVAVTRLSRRLFDEFLGGFRQQLVGCFAIN